MSKEIEIDAELQEAIAKSVAESLDLDNKIANAVNASAGTIVDEVVKALDKPVKKDLGTDEEEVEVAEKTAKVVTSQKDALIAKFDGMSKERRFFKAIQALTNGDDQYLRAYNAYTGEKLAQVAVDKGLIDVAQKAGYANEAVTADGKVIVPDPEFNTTVYNNLPKYGVVFSDANVQTTDRNAVYALSLTGTISFTSTAEAGTISGSKLAFSRGLQQLVKYAAIVPATEELTDDAIIDYWTVVTNEVARNYAKTADQIAFTDSTMGILHTSGIITQPIASGGAGTGITWDDLLNAEGKLEDGLDTSTFKFYMRKETFFRLAQIKASTAGTYLADSMLAGWAPNPNSPTTPWGTPIKFTRVLDRSVDAGITGTTNDGFVVYGDLSNYNFYTKNGLEIKMLTEATVNGSDGASYNLATQDGIAMRIVVRMLGILPAGNASKFVVIGTGTVS